MPWRYSEGADARHRLRPRIAVENHAGDLQARELGSWSRPRPDVVGVCLDAGNALWAMEDPQPDPGDAAHM